MKKLAVLFCILFSAQSQASLPDFGAIKDTRAKKKAFFSYLLPRIKQENKRILQQRQFIKSHLHVSSLSSSNHARLNNIAANYGMKPIQSNLEAQKLLSRVDAVPASMVMAQAANESAWGTSRFARLGSNLFGQWCYQKGCGIVPSRRSAGMHHEVRVFKNVDASIASYMNNLNTNRTYALFRNLRAKSRKQHQKISGTNLAQGLVKYSERGMAYVKEIRAMIHINHLEQFDNIL